mmetsp:Transcript_19185/g.3097  ORF Transcript_19185/g.3097 Transcript_19185/m.3097 type:complete len:147 (+) Transcript_19185:931-1371(+)
MHLIICPLSLITVPTFKHHFPLSLLPSLNEITSIHIAGGIHSYSSAVDLALMELALIPPSISPSVYAQSSHLIIYPASLVRVTIEVSNLAVALSHTILIKFPQVVVLTIVRVHVVIARRSVLHRASKGTVTRKDLLVNFIDYLTCI